MPNQYITDALSHEYPFGGTSAARVNDLVRGRAVGSPPMADKVPTGAEAKALWEAAGLPAAIVQDALGLTESDFDAWVDGRKELVTVRAREDGSKYTVSEVLPHDVGEEGVRRLFGTLAAYLAAA